MLPHDVDAFEFDADYRVGPTILGQRPGKLRLLGGRLSFVEAGGTVRFDAPLGEIHSPAVAEMGSAVEVWHGAERHRLVMSGGGTARYWPPGWSDGVVGTIAALDTALANAALYRTQKAAASDLLAFLRSRAGMPPQGVRARRPAGSVRYVLTVVAVIAGIVAAVFGVMWAAFG